MFDAVICSDANRHLTTEQNASDCETFSENITFSFLYDYGHFAKHVTQLQNLP